MARWLIYWAIVTVTLLVLPYLFSGVTINEPTTALIAALILGLINTFIKPVISLLTLPLQIFSLGIVTLLINAFFLWFVSNVVNGFHIDSFGTAFWAAIVYSLISLIKSESCLV